MVFGPNTLSCTYLITNRIIISHQVLWTLARFSINMAKQRYKGQFEAEPVEYCGTCNRFHNSVLPVCLNLGNLKSILACHLDLQNQGHLQLATIMWISIEIVHT